MNRQIKNSITTAFVLLSMLTYSLAQITDTIAGERLDSMINTGQICFDPIPEDDSVHVYAEQMPEFPGGKDALKRYLIEHTVYPNITRESAIQGTVYIRLVITKSGDIGKIEIYRGIDPLLDQSATDVIKKLPKFKPAMQDGKPVNCYLILPVKFQLN